MQGYRLFISHTKQQLKNELFYVHVIGSQLLT